MSQENRQVDVAVVVQVAVRVGRAAGRALVGQQCGKVGEIHDGIEIEISDTAAEDYRDVAQRAAVQRVQLVGVSV